MCVCVCVCARARWRPPTLGAPLHFELLYVFTVLTSLTFGCKSTAVVNKQGKAEEGYLTSTAQTVYAVVK